MTIAGSVSRIAKALANSISSSETPLLKKLSQEQGLVHPDLQRAVSPITDSRTSVPLVRETRRLVAREVAVTISADKSVEYLAEDFKNHELARENYLMEISGCNESGDGSDE